MLGRDKSSDCVYAIKLLRKDVILEKVRGIYFHEPYKYQMKMHRIGLDRNHTTIGRLFQTENVFCLNVNLK